MIYLFIRFPKRFACRFAAYRYSDSLHAERDAAIWRKAGAVVETVSVPTY